MGFHIFDRPWITDHPPPLHQHILDVYYLRIVKVTHNACSLHLATHFQTQTFHMGMFYMVY